MDIRGLEKKIAVYAVLLSVKIPANITEGAAGIAIALLT